jgi:hypothetical protein
MTPAQKSQERGDSETVQFIATAQHLLHQMCRHGDAPSADDEEKCECPAPHGALPHAADVPRLI